MGQLVFAESVDAVIALSDTRARAVMEWFSLVEPMVPGSHPAVVSFDNVREQQYPFSISSVDFGFDRLGYVAAHIIIGDTYAKVGPNRSVSAIPTLNHTCTV
jgi:DNA-binding LacI/PurR family transcriptional regulator